MPIRQYVDTTQAFDPEAIRVMNAALDCALAELKLVDRDDPAVALVARRVITFAEQGERDPIKLCHLTLESIRE